MRFLHVERLCRVKRYFKLILFCEEASAAVDFRR